MLPKVYCSGLKLKRRQLLYFVIATIDKTFRFVFCNMQCDLSYIVQETFQHCIPLKSGGNLRMMSFLKEQHSTDQPMIVGFGF